MTNIINCNKQETRELGKVIEKGCEQKKDILKNIEEFLINSGVDPNFKGFLYLSEAIKMKMENPKVLYVNGIYTTIAKKYGKSKENISSCIRTVVFKGYKNMDYGLKKKIWDKDFIRAFPSNSQFINGIAEFLSEIL